MTIFRSIKKNIHFFPIHLIFFLLRFTILYGMVKPVEVFFENFFDARMIKHDLLEYSDIHAVIEFFISGLNQDSSFIIILLIIGFVLFFLLDVTMDAGFVYSFYKNDWREFWKGINTKIFSLMFLKILIFIALISIMFFVLNVFFALQKSGVNLMMMPFYIFVVGIMVLFFVRFSDIAKANLLVHNLSVWDSLIEALTCFFLHIKQVLIGNTITMFIFVIGIYIYFTIDLNLYATSNLLILLSLVVQQIFFLLKQMLRYSYLDWAISSINFLSPGKNDIVVTQK